MREADKTEEDWVIIGIEEEKREKAWNELKTGLDLLGLNLVERIKDFLAADPAQSSAIVIKIINGLKVYKPFAKRYALIEAIFLLLEEEEKVRLAELFLVHQVFSVSLLADLNPQHPAYYTFAKEGFLQKREFEIPQHQAKRLFFEYKERCFKNPELKYGLLYATSQEQAQKLYLLYQDFAPSFKKPLDPDSSLQARVLWELLELIYTDEKAPGLRESLCILPIPTSVKRGNQGRGNRVDDDALQEAFDHIDRARKEGFLIRGMEEKDKRSAYHGGYGLEIEDAKNWDLAILRQGPGQGMILGAYVQACLLAREKGQEPNLDLPSSYYRDRLQHLKNLVNREGEAAFNALRQEIVEFYAEVKASGDEALLAKIKPAILAMSSLEYHTPENSYRGSLKASWRSWIKSYHFPQNLSWTQKMLLKVDPDLDFSSDDQAMSLAMGLNS